MPEERSYHTIVVGGGQAGLAAAYFLRQKGIDFVVLDSHIRVGESWRKRWDSLRLFTPSKFDSLPEAPLQKPDFYFPTKNEIADYLEQYAERFDLPVQLGIRVDRLERKNGGYLLTAGPHRFSAVNVVVATGAYQKPYTPSFARECDGTVVHLHSNDYKEPSQLPGGPILVVGAGNSGAEIAIELARTGHKVWLAGRSVGRIPANTVGRVFGGKPYWFFISRVLSVDTPIGKKVQQKALSHGTPLIRLKPKDVTEAGVSRCARIQGMVGGVPRLENGNVLEVKGIVWATGFRPDYSWIGLPITNGHGYPIHERGVIPQSPGLFFVGLPFQTALTSSLIGGVATDARCVVDEIVTRERGQIAIH